MTAQAGLAFRVASQISDLNAFVSNLMGCAVSDIGPQYPKGFDTRNHHDILVERYGNVYFVSNDGLVSNILESQEIDVSGLYEAIGSPPLIIAFCCYDAGGSFGYTFVEEGRRTRTRLETTGIPGLPPLLENGPPKDFELPWLNAAYFYEEEGVPHSEQPKIFFLGNRDKLVSESQLTRHLLVEALQQCFGVCPWVSEEKPEYHYFRLATAPGLTPPIEAAPALINPGKMGASRDAGPLWNRIKTFLKR